MFSLTWREPESSDDSSKAGDPIGLLMQVRQQKKHLNKKNGNNIFLCKLHKLNVKSQFPALSLVRASSKVIVVHKSLHQGRPWHSDGLIPLIRPLSSVCSRCVVYCSWFLSNSLTCNRKKKKKKAINLEEKSVSSLPFCPDFSMAGIVSGAQHTL